MAAIIKRLMTAAGILNRLKGVDGAGSGLDADLLDGLQGAAYAKLSGGAGAAFTGNASITQAAASAIMTVGANAGQLRLYGLLTDGTNRWYIGASQEAESGANAGSNFGIYRYADNGGFLDVAMSIARDSGAVDFNGTVNSDGGVYDGGVRVARTNAANTFTTRQTVTPTNNVGVFVDKAGDTTPHFYADMSSSVNTGDQFFRFVSAGTTSGSITANGASNVAYNTSSDPRLKKNIRDLDIAECRDRIARVRLHAYNWIIDGAPGRGVLANELQEVIPEAVSGVEGAIEEEWVVGAEEQPRFVTRGPDEDGLKKIEARAPNDADLHPLGERISPQGVDYSKCIPDVIGALQWALGRIDQLEARIAALESG